MPTPSRTQFREIEVIRHPECEGVVAVISERLSNGNLSFMLAKEFERDGETTRTTFLARRHVDKAQRILELVAERIDQLVDERRAHARAS